MYRVSQDVYIVVYCTQHEIITLGLYSYWEINPMTSDVMSRNPKKMCDPLLQEQGSCIYLLTIDLSSRVKEMLTKDLVGTYFLWTHHPWLIIHVWIAHHYFIILPCFSILHLLASMIIIINFVIIIFWGLIFRFGLQCHLILSRGRNPFFSSCTELKTLPTV